MKIIILSILVIFLNLPESNAQSMLEAVLHPVCSQDPLSYSGLTNCPRKFPVKAMAKLFDTEIDKVIKVSANPNFSELEIFRRNVNDESGEGYTKFQTIDHAFYMKTDKNRRIIQLHQGIEGSGCFYKYTIKTLGPRRYCNADPVKVSDPVKPDELKCITTHANDPIKNPGKHRKSCDAFLEAMISCSKDNEASATCSKEFMALLDKKDSKGKPRPSPYNKPMPAIDGSAAQ